MKKVLFVACTCLLMQVADAKKELTHLGIAVTNSVTAFPVTGFPRLFYSQFHPGITLSTGFNWKEKPRHNLMQTFKLGFFSHRYIQHSFTLYTEFAYRYKSKGRWGYTAALGAGYLHMIPGSDQFRMNDNGDWEKIRFRSRPQGLISLSLGVDYRISEKGSRLFMRYQNMLQTPFVPGYVPLLPYNVLHLGVSIPMSVLKKGANNA